VSSAEPCTEQKEKWPGKASGTKLRQ